jgi:hypothetical protein
VIELSELYRIARNAELLLGPLVTATPAILADKLRPHTEDYGAVFLGEAAERAREGYAGLWANPPKALAKAHQTNIRAFAAEADSFGTDNEFSREFPGGYRSIASHLVPDRVWIVWRLLEPNGEVGMTYDGLVWMRDHWAWFPKPWRVLEAPITN